MSGRTEAERRLLFDISLLTLELKLHTFVALLERHYNPDQPRVPAGNPDGGEWTSGAGTESASARSELATLRTAQLNGFTQHAVDQAINRSVSPAAILDAIQNPIKIRPRPNGTTQYIGGSATVVLNGSGTAVTVWGQ